MAELRRLTLESGSEWAATDLTMTQLRAIGIVRLRQPVSIGLLSSAMGMSLASGSALADRLVRGGYLVRREDAEDRRRVFVEVRPEGTAILNRIAARSRAKMRRAIDAMEPHEREALTTALGGFIRVLRERAG